MWLRGVPNAPLWGAGLIQMLISFCTIISSLNSARLIHKFGTGRLTAPAAVSTVPEVLPVTQERPPSVL